jgi:spermidine synthase
MYEGFAAVLTEVLNRGDAAACTTEETVRRVDDALTDAGLAVVNHEQLKAVNAAWAAERMAEMHERLEAASAAGDGGIAEPSAMDLWRKGRGPRPGTKAGYW